MVEKMHYSVCGFEKKDKGVYIMYGSKFSFSSPTPLTFDLPLGALILMAEEHSGKGYRLNDVSISKYLLS